MALSAEVTSPVCLGRRRPISDDRCSEHPVTENLRMKKTRTRARNPLDHEPEAVTYARRQAGLTKTQLAQACGVSLSLISEIESGTRNATPTMIIKLAEALNCPRVVLERKRDYRHNPGNRTDRER
jgi:DNA-binding XRE family transcriptional regulator